MTPPSDIEAAATRVLKHDRFNARYAHWSSTTYRVVADDLFVLAPQLAQAVLKMLPVIEAARAQVLLSWSDPDLMIDEYAALRSALAALDTPEHP